MAKKSRKNKRGQGRKALPYQTTTIRVPVPCLEPIAKVVAQFKKRLTK